MKKQFFALIVPAVAAAALAACGGSAAPQGAPAPTATAAENAGAGDAFVAGVAHAQLCGTAFPDCALMGLRAAHAALLSPLTVNPDVGKYCCSEEN